METNKSTRMVVICVGGVVLLGLFFTWFFGNFFYDLFWAQMAAWGWEEAKVIAFTLAHIVPFVFSTLVIVGIYILLRREMAARAAIGAMTSPSTPPVGPSLPIGWHIPRNTASTATPQHVTWGMNSEILAQNAAAETRPAPVLQTDARGASPAFIVKFRPKRDIRRNVQMFQSTTGAPVDVGTHVLLHVEATGRGRVIRCQGWIISVEKLDAAKAVVAEEHQTRQLLWAPREQHKTVHQILPNLPQDLDLFRTRRAVGKLELLSLAHSYAWDTFFDLPGTYRITVTVQGDQETEVVKLLVNWRGKWDDFDVEQE